MSGYMMLMSPFLVCKKIFGSNPNLVPSLKNEPICRECVEAANIKRKEMGMVPFPINPGAYEAAEA